jgi:hypothetical protein
MSTQLKHETMRVRDIVKHFRDGRLLVPEFQRDYVWGRNRAPKLIDSLYRKYPISSLLLWETEEDVEVRRREPRRASGASISWLIDGQQRVLTIHKAMSGGDGLEVVFNTETENFRNANAATRNDFRWKPVDQVWNDDSFFRGRSARLTC